MTKLFTLDLETGATRTVLVEIDENNQILRIFDKSWDFSDYFFFVVQLLFLYILCYPVFLYLQNIFSVFFISRLPFFDEIREYQKYYTQVSFDPKEVKPLYSSPTFPPYTFVTAEKIQNLMTAYSSGQISIKEVKQDLKRLFDEKKLTVNKIVFCLREQLFIQEEGIENFIRKTLLNQPSSSSSLLRFSSSSKKE